MSDYQLRQAELESDLLGTYNDWIIDNEDEIIYRWAEELLANNSFPENIFEGVVDDDYEVAIKDYLSSLTIDDVSSEFISELFHNWEL